MWNRRNSLSYSKTWWNNLIKIKLAIKFIRYAIVLDICVVEVLKLILHLKTRFPVLLINIVCRLIFLQWLFRFAKIIENIFYLCKLFLHWRFLYIRDRRFRLNKLSALKFTVKNYRTLIINLKLISLCILIDLCWTSIINMISIFLIKFSLIINS